jgi:hypothetical protein
MADILTSEQAHRIVLQAMREPSFKQALLDHPHATIEQELGVTVPAGKTVHVMQAEAQTLSIVIPQRPVDWPADLSVEDAMARLLGDRPEMDEQTRKAADMQLRLTAKAWQDERFREDLERHPKATVAQALDVELPEDLNLQVLIEDAEHQYLLLPPQEAGMELTDEQLEAVSGGEVGVLVSIITLVAVGSMAVSKATTW